MIGFAEAALPLVGEMTEAAAAEPARAVSFQGAPGCNGHRAALEFDQNCLPLPCFTFEDALDAVERGRVARAIIPIENSQHGRVADIHLLLPESGLNIVGEHFMAIHHTLMGLNRGPFRTAYSHPQALGQTRLYLRTKGIVPVAYPDTAAAAAYVSELGEPSACAIAPTLAASLYGLEIVEEDIEDSPDNTTRFVIFSKEPNDPAMLVGKPAMTSLIFKVKNVPAALYKALGGFATNMVNMTKLESYQKDASFAATMFFVDFVGVPGEAPVDRAIAELSFHCRELRLLGSYPMERQRK